jgi:4-amino-4-deoxy-L-arabinose transferase-like glycosyltransferase
MGNSGESASKSHFQIVRDWCVAHPNLALTLATVAALVPFLAKPFNLDDPLFVWAAQHIQSHPTDPYGFDVNWIGTQEPMWRAMMNPPLMSYYLALAAKLFGWSEIGLHLSCLVFAIAVILGTYRLAAKFCKWPMLAALATLFAPAFMVSSTTVMCDVSMLAFWIWAIVFWIEGVKQNNFCKLSAAAALIGLAILTKFNGVCLIPLLAAFAWIERRSIGQWAAFLLIPVATLCAYEWITFHLYGHPHFLMAGQVSRTNQVIAGTRNLLEVFTAMTFIGGCFAIALFCTPYLWQRRTVLAFALVGAVFTALAVSRGMMTRNYSWLSGSVLTSIELQILLWSMTGVSVLALAAAELWEEQNSESWLLFFWLVGLLVYAALIYFMLNGRSVLAMGPAIAILIVRRLERKGLLLPAGIKVSFIASAALSLLAAHADFQQAETARQMTQQICRNYSAASTRVWFQGHWGFQYYMQLAGAWPVDLTNSKLLPGDILVDPEGNSNDPRIDRNITVLDSEVSLADFPWFATHNSSLGAGFYSSFWGPLPFAFGSVPPEKVFAYTLRDPRVVSPRDVTGEKLRLGSRATSPEAHIVSD